MTLTLLKGRRIQGPVTNLAAAGAANAVVIFQQSTFAAMVGTKSYRLKRVKLQNDGNGNTFVHIGTGVAGAFADGIPALLSLNGLNLDLVEDDLPEVEFFADLTAYPEAAAGGGINIQVEVEEIG